VIIFRNKKYNFKGKASPKAARVPKLPIGRWNVTYSKKNVHWLFCHKTLGKISLSNLQLKNSCHFNIILNSLSLIGNYFVEHIPASLQPYEQKKSCSKTTASIKISYSINFLINSATANQVFVVYWRLRTNL
jgi:hypothetical protein